MKQQMPEQDRPIYEFWMQPSGEIGRAVHTRYKICHYATGIGTRIRYMFKTPTGAIVSKTPEQMDRFLSGHVFTFRDDRDRARELMRSYYETGLADAKKKMKRYKHMLAMLSSEGGRT